jgi:hypothetical protein
MNFPGITASPKSLYAFGSGASITGDGNFILAFIQEYYSP